MLDINLFREEKGGNPEIVRESQRRRFAKVELVDEVIALDKTWRECRFQLDELNREFNKINKEIAKKKIAKEDASELIAQSKSVDAAIQKKKEEENDCRLAVEKACAPIGNLIHDSVPIDNNEDNNAVIRTWGTKREEDNLISHVDLVNMLGIADLDKGASVAGNRGYYLKGMGVMLNQALINFGLAFLSKRGYTPLQTPFFMRQPVMAECAQLAQFDEELYKVTGEGDDKYLIATSEQPLCAYFRGDWLDPKNLPIKLAGYSTCFRKEAGSHGRDTLGIFRVHQFEKVEQFCITSPLDNASWEMLEEMLKNSEEFYQALGLSYRVVAIVSGALNDAAAKKYDLEAWFPGSKAFRELVSCSNCTDFQSRQLETRFGIKKMNEQNKQYCHMLNSTLTATERTLCCLLETYQTPEGIKVPECLQPFVGADFVPFIAKEEKKDKKAKQPKGGKSEGKKPSTPDKKEVAAAVKAAGGAAAAAVADPSKPAPSPKGGVTAKPATPAGLEAVKVYVDGKSAESRAVKLFCLEASVASCLCEGPEATVNGPSEPLGGRGLPMLVDGDLVLRQSHAMMRYLAAKLKSPLFPVDSPASTARVEQVLEWQGATWQPLVGQLASKQEGVEAKVEAGLGQLEAWLVASAGKYLTGRGLTIADISVACATAELLKQGVSVKEGPVKAWFEGITGRPHWTESQ